MKNQAQLYIFGEVLFDCFPTGEEILGGAPFNVAWHLQAFGDQPCFISRVGRDDRGTRVLQAMRTWGLDAAAVQVDAEHPTGRVEVMIQDNEPSYDIVADSAYDYISAEQVNKPLSTSILYHGTLCLRSRTSRNALREITRHHNVKIFLDVNLRPPWWQRDEVFDWLKSSHWVKMNQEELRLLGGTAADLQQQMAELQESCGLEQLIVTRGEHGTLIRTAAGEFHSLIPEKVERLVDTVGAGDAFSAVYIHGLRVGWPIETSLYHAQLFASKIIGLRGATTTDSAFYQEFIRSFSRC